VNEEDFDERDMRLDAESTLAAVRKILSDTPIESDPDPDELAMCSLHDLLRTPALATGERPKLDCCVQGHHSFSWRQGIEACRYCGEPVATGEGGTGGRR
jgi:hypothetical protein